jgi:hypothetical protein
VKVRGTASLAAKEKLFTFLCGLWISLSLLKFGNPVIFDQMIGAPKDWAEFVFTSWPISWGYVLLALVVVASIPLLKPRFDRRHWPVTLLGIWLFWQILSSARTVDPKLTQPTLTHFISCGVSFLLGWWALAPRRGSGWFWGPVIVGFFYVLFNGFDQHAGGLEATRKAFYEQPDWQQYPKEYLLKIQSNRIFSTLVYPNAFAGVILLLFPPVLCQAWVVTERWPRVLRGVLAGLFIYLGLACFYWTGSKGGWLIALVVAGVWALQTKIPPRLKYALIGVGLVVGVTAFFVRFGSYFEKGATSVGARFEYWKAAVEIVKRHPILGTGPGTFSVLYKQIKPPDAEMARLVHNDYLEQASDAGILGGLAYLGAIAGLLVTLRPDSSRRLDLLIWLGLLGWSLQAFIEFGLYIPALAWPAFLFFGVLVGAREVLSAGPERAGALQKGHART